MPVFDKLLIIFLMNIALLGYLLARLIYLGNSFFKSLKMTWNWVVGGLKIESEEVSLVKWVPVLAKTWWLGNIFYGLNWLMSQELDAVIMVGILTGLHILWYLSTLITVKEKYDRSFHIHSNWGIIYKEIDQKSVFIQKSLAELDLRKKNLLILAIERNNQLIPFPKGLEIIECGDRLVIFGDLSMYYSITG